MPIDSTDVSASLIIPENQSRANVIEQSSPHTRVFMTPVASLFANYAWLLEHFSEKREYSQRSSTLFKSLREWSGTVDNR